FMLSLIDLGDHYFKILLNQGIAIGVAAGLVFIPSLAIQTDHRGTRSTLAMGIASTGEAVCRRAFFPIVLNQPLRHGVSFPWTVRASSFVVLGMLLVANACMRSAYPHASPPKGEKPTTMRELVTNAPYV
ncbi:hypothetical protein FA95DRAFT_1498837, partial [Auriscalpium vulgare]